MREGGGGERAVGGGGESENSGALFSLLNVHALAQPPKGAAGMTTARMVLTMDMTAVARYHDGHGYVALHRRCGQIAR